MRITNGAAPVTGRAGKAALGIAVAGGAAVFVLAGGGIAMASTLPAQATITTTWNHLYNVPGGGSTSTSPTGWSRVNNVPGNRSSTTGGGKGKGSAGGGTGVCTTTGAGEGKLNGLCGNPGTGSTPTSPTGWSRVNNA